MYMWTFVSGFFQFSIYTWDYIVRGLNVSEVCFYEQTKSAKLMFVIFYFFLAALTEVQWLDVFIQKLVTFWWP